MDVMLLAVCKMGATECIIFDFNQYTYITQNKLRVKNICAYKYKLTS